MAYTAIPDTDVDTNSPVDEDLTTALRDNDQALRLHTLTVYITEQTTNSVSPTFATLTSFKVFLPNFPNESGYQRQLIVSLDVKIGDAAETGTFKLTDNAAAVDSNTVTTTSTTYEEKTLTLNFVDGLQNTTRTIDVKGHTTNASHLAALQSIDRITARVLF